MHPTLYLFFKGNCLEAMTHYAKVLGGEIRKEDILRNADAPDPESRMPGNDNLIMNMSMRLGGMTIMASDNTDELYEAPQGFRIHVEAPTRAEFDRTFADLSKNTASVEMAPGETFWAERFAMFTDRYGTPWMLGHTGNKAKG